MDLTGHDIRLNDIFIRRFCGFKIDHISNVSYRDIAKKGRSPINIPLDDYLSLFDNTSLQLGFGYGDDGIILSSKTVKAHRLRFMLFDMIDMDHESGVLDTYISIYGEAVSGYVPRGRK